VNIIIVSSQRPEAANLTQGGERFSPFGPASPLSACPLWICLSDKIPWRPLAAVLISAHLMILVCYATYHLGPGPPEISQFVFKCPDSRIDWSLSTISPLYLSIPPSLSLSGTLSFPCTPLHHDRFGALVNLLTCFMYSGNFLSIYLLHYASC